MFLAGLACGVMAYWLNPYNVMTVGGIHIYVILCLTVLGASILSAYRTERPALAIVRWVCSGAMAGVIGRILFDIARDPTTHNLFPFEIIATLVISVLSAVTGVFLARVIRRIKGA